MGQISIVTFIRLYIRKNPIASFFVIVVVVVFCVHAWNRNNHFQECDSSLVYDSLYNFPRSQLSFNANTYSKGGIFSKDVARRIIEHPVIKGIVSPYYSGDLNEEKVVEKLSEAKPVALLRFGMITALYKAQLPHSINGLFALPLGSTYSAGVGFVYGLISGAKTTYEDFMSRATLVTLFLFHAGVLLLFFAALRMGIRPSVAAIAGLWALFSVSLYSYGYHLGSTVWNFWASALWFWFLVFDQKKPDFLKRMSRVTGVLAFFNYLIVFYWGALMIVRVRGEWKSGGNTREKMRKLFGLGKTQLFALVCFFAVAVLFYPPGQSGGTFFFGQLFHNLYFIVLNFFSMYTHSELLNIIQFIVSYCVLMWFFFSLRKRALRTEDEVVPKTLLVVFCLFLVGVAAGVLAFVPSRHILFLAPALFLAVAVGLHRIFERRQIRESMLASLSGIVLLLGIFGLQSRLADTRNAAAGISTPPDVAAIIVEDCGWSFIYGNFHPGIPAYHTEAAVLKAGATYAYVSQSRSLDDAIAGWRRDYKLDVRVKKFEESEKVTNAYFVAHNPDRLPHTRPNNLYTAKFEILEIASRE